LFLSSTNQPEKHQCFSGWLGDNRKAGRGSRRLIVHLDNPWLKKIEEIAL
jgi:hypothetical protein